MPYPRCNGLAVILVCCLIRAPVRFCFSYNNEGTVMLTLQNSKLLALFLSICLVASCQSGLRSNVVAFHEEPLPMGETIKVLPLDPEKSDSLEFRNYSNLIREELRKIGYTPVDINEDSELIAEVDYGVETGPTSVSVDPMSSYDRFARYHFYAGRYYDPFYFGIYDTWTPRIYSTPTF